MSLLGDLPHRAVLWKRLGSDSNGRPTVSDAPEEIACRWDGQRRVVAGPDGEPIAITATLITDRELTPGSAVWKGGIDDLPGTGQTPTINVMEVVSSQQADDIRGGDEEVWTSTLQKSANTLHTTATEIE